MTSDKMKSIKFNKMWETVDQFSLEFNEDIPSQLLCIWCKRVLRNAKQVPCGCRFCSHCLESYIENGNLLCPGDSEECHQQVFSNEVVYQEDNYANKEISKLEIKCISDGCEVRDTVRQICEHVLVCDLLLCQCPQCEASLPRGEMEDHIRNLCSESSMECRFCGVTKTKREMETDHLNLNSEDICDLYECVCPYDCGVDDLVQIKMHARVCNNQSLRCPYYDLGCGLETLRRGEMEGHLCHEGYKHTGLLLQTISNLENEVRRLEATVTYMTAERGRLDALERAVENMKRENDDLRANGMGATVGADEGSVMTLRRRLDMIELKYDKKYFEYVWRVPNFKQLVNQSRIDPDKYLLSDPFFTSKNGYKIQLILYANGHGAAFNRSLSLYYQIIKGKMDEILQWPFKFNVELRLLDQDGQNHRVFNVFFDPTDDEMIENYQRPFSNELRLFGAANFVTKDRMNRSPNLRKNDTLFIQFCAKPVNLEE